AHRPRGALVGRFLQTVAVATLVFLLFRLLMIVPGDLYARLLIATIRYRPAPVEEAPPPPGEKGEPPVLEGKAKGRDRGPPGGLAFWRSEPGLEDGFLGHLVLITWWIGGPTGLVLVWRAGGRWSDLLPGLIAGAGAGLVVMGSLGCVLQFLDGV